MAIKFIHSVCSFAFAVLLALPGVRGDEPKPAAPLTDAERAVRTVPTKIAATYRNGVLTELRLKDRMAYIVKPTGPIDSQKRWLWEFPFWLGINDGFDNLQHRNYLEKALDAGFH